MLGVNATPGPSVPGDQRARQGPGWGLALRPVCSVPPPPGHGSSSRPGSLAPQHVSHSEDSVGGHW